MLSKICRALLFSCIRLIPATRGYRLKAALLRAAGVAIAPTARVISSVRILGPQVVIGADTFIGHETMLVGAQDTTIRIGDNVDISSRVSLVTGTHEIDMLNAHSAGEGLGKDIVIEDGVWIGFGAIILPGVTIGTKAVIGAGSVVVKNIPPYSIAVGNPCKPVKQWDSEEKTFVSSVTN